MNARIRLVFAIQLFLLPLTLFAADGRDAMWRKAEADAGKGLPKTVIRTLEPIIKGAIEEKAHAEAIKAIAGKVVFEEESGRILSPEGFWMNAGDHVKIARMEAEIEKAPREMRPVMTAIVANWYW